MASEQREQKEVLTSEPSLPRKEHHSLVHCVGLMFLSDENPLLPVLSIREAIDRTRSDGHFSVEGDGDVPRAFLL